MKIFVYRTHVKIFQAPRRYYEGAFRTLSNVSVVVGKGLARKSVIGSPRRGYINKPLGAFPKLPSFLYNNNTYIPRRRVRFSFLLSTFSPS